MTARPAVVVVGHGMVGHRLVELLAAGGVTRSHDVVVLAEERWPAYDRVNLSSGFTTAGAPAGFLAADRFADDPAVRLHLDDAVSGIDRAARAVTTVSGRVETYETLVLATGARPVVPPIPGVDVAGCFSYRTLDDLQAIRAAAETAGRGVVVGGGLLGLEAANALRLLGVQVSVVEQAPGLMPTQLDLGAAEALRRHLERLGIGVHAGVRVDALSSHGDRVGGVRLVDADASVIELEADLVVVAVGVRPRDELARGCGLEVGARGGVAVDATCTTSDPAIVAIGDCASTPWGAVGLVAPGYAMAEVVASRLSGGEARLEPPDASTTLKVLGVDVASFGDAFAAEAADAVDLVYANPVTGLYAKLVVSDDGRRLHGGMLVGDTSAYATLRALARSRAELPCAPEALVLPAGSVGVDAPGLIADADMVCTCNSVDAGSIRAAVRDGCGDLRAVKACTSAGTGCGSCIPLTTRLLRTELQRSGVVLGRGICEHFDVTRQELFDLVRYHRHRSFSAVLAAHGRGRGCDICKPAIASILATQAPGHVLDGEGATIQDTNDHFLANLQRDGTYSVVPRLPGGEVTPDKLIAIGEVARDFELYVKITGGQRIDMFGARVEQLPSIWRRLVDAGLESGHAYAKALRTVKSCVGNTWCRFGVGDSTALAVKLELRYRGLRAPHKLKSAVSGCARECAEAQSKDFGVVAGENGWTLYVCGNGGFRPRHADVLARELDETTLIRYVDRFLMFYIRTADRLQRTAPWLESLEGGIDHLRSVIVDDCLGIAAELEAEMERHIASYACEWRETVEDPERMERFVSFINAPRSADPTVIHVRERGQPRPARPHERAAAAWEAPLVGVR